MLGVEIAHTYFEYNVQGATCEKAADLANAASERVVISNLIHVTETGSESPSYSSQMSFNLCISEEGFAREDLSIAAYALRQHLRFDVGLALNVQFSKIEGNCVNGSAFAPISNSRAVERLLTSFDSADDAYAARYSAAAIIYHCSKGNVTHCSSRKIQSQKNGTPLLNIETIQ